MTSLHTFLVLGHQAQWRLFPDMSLGKAPDKLGIIGPDSLLPSLTPCAPTPEAVSILGDSVRGRAMGRQHCMVPPESMQWGVGNYMEGVKPPTVEWGVGLSSLYPRPAFHPHLPVQFPTICTEPPAMPIHGVGVRGLTAGMNKGMGGWTDGWMDERMNE